MRVKLLPLLSRTVEIGTVELDGLHVNLTRDAQRRGNWQDLLDARTAPPAGASIGPADSAGVSVESFAIEGVRVRRGTVMWRENVSELRYTVSELDLSTGSIGDGDPVALDVALKLRNEITGLTADVTASATTAIDGERLGHRARRRGNGERESRPRRADPSAHGTRRDRRVRPQCANAARRRAHDRDRRRARPRGRLRAARCSTTPRSRARERHAGAARNRVRAARLAAARRACRRASSATSRSRPSSASAPSRARSA